MFYVPFLLISLGLLVKTVFNAQSFYFREMTNSMCQTGIIGILYEKMFRMDSKQVHHLDIGKLTNEITNDLRRASFVTKSIMRSTVMPIIILTLMAVLITQYGVATCVGLSIILLNFLVLSVLGIWIARINKTKLRNTDFRNKELTMGLQGIKTIKFNCWEKLLMDRINLFRRTEEKLVFRQTFIRILMEVLGFIMPCVASLVTVLILQGSDRTVSVGDVFFIISIFHCIVSPMKQFGDGFSRLAQAKVSFSRLEKIVNLPDESLHEKYSTQTKGVPVKGSIVLKRLSLGVTVKSKGKSTIQPLLKNLNVTIKPGQLVVVHGAVSSGKSMLLNGLIDSLEVLSGSKKMSGSVSFLPQTSFLMTDSIRNNVLFGEDYDFLKYQKCIKLSQMEGDLRLLEDGDRTQVTENGVNLSGGQKQRVALARALYQDSDIYLMDDVLSAIDNHLSSRIFSEAIYNHLRARRKTVVICSNDLGLLKYADVQIEVKNRQIFVEYNTQSDTFKVESFDNDAGLDDLSCSSDVRSEKPGKTRALSLCEKVDAFNLKKMTRLTEEAHQTRDKSGKLSENTIESTQVSTEDSSIEGTDLTNRKQDDLSNKNSQSLILEYLSVNSLPQFVLVFGLTFLMILSKLSLDFLLGRWVMSNSQGLYLILSCFVILLLVMLGLSRAVFISRFFQQTSSIIFKTFVTKILGKSMRYFNRTPTGRLLNLSSKDIDTIDLIFPQQMAIIIFCAVQLVVICFSVVLNCFWLLFFVGLLFYCLYRYIQFYIGVSQDLKRQELASYSPLISRIIEVYNGIFVFRKSNAVSRQKQIFAGLVDDTAKMFMGQARITAYTQMLCEGTTSLFICVVCCVLVLIISGKGEVSKSELTLLSANLNWMVIIPSFMNLLLVYYSFFCQSIISAERVFKMVPHERSDLDWAQTEPRYHSLNGHIELQRVCFQYSKKSQVVLKDLSLEIKAGEKVGIVGKTGSGKSSLVLALTKMIPIMKDPIFLSKSSNSKGSDDFKQDSYSIEEQIGSNTDMNTNTYIKIDGMNIDDLKERDLRHSVGIINQESFIIEGTLKENMDPLNKFSNQQTFELVLSMGILDRNTINEVLERNVIHREFETGFSKAEIAKIMEFRIKENGKNISLGQKQLICISRLVLKKPKIVFIDEGTANIDSEKDGMIQKLIKDKLPESTIISIAHRVDTLEGYDKIVVMDAGEIVEQGSPEELLRRKGQFWELVHAKKKPIM